MLITAVRLGVLLATLVASLRVTAEPPVWILTDVRLSDGAVATGYLIYDDYYQSQARQIIAGSLVLNASPPPLTTVQVDEFHHSALRHYFVTAASAEKQDLDVSQRDRSGLSTVESTARLQPPLHDECSDQSADDR